MSSIAVSGFNDDVIALRKACRLKHHRIMRPAEVAAEQDRDRAIADANHGSSQDLPSRPEFPFRPIDKRKRLVVGDRLQIPQGSAHPIGG